MAIAHLAADANKINKTGRILRTSDLAREYGFVDLVSILFHVNYYLPDELEVIKCELLGILHYLHG